MIERAAVPAAFHDPSDRPERPFLDHAVALPAAGRNVDEMEADLRAGHQEHLGADLNHRRPAGRPAILQDDGTTLWSIAPNGATSSAVRASMRTRSPKRMNPVAALPPAIISIAGTSEIQLDPTSA